MFEPKSFLFSATLFTVFLGAPLAHANDVKVVETILGQMSHSIDYVSDNAQNCTKHFAKIQKHLAVIREKHDNLTAIFQAEKETLLDPKVCKIKGNAPNLIIGDAVKNYIAEIKAGLATTEFFITADFGMTTALALADGYPECKPHATDPSLSVEGYEFELYKQNLAKLDELGAAIESGPSCKTASAGSFLTAASFAKPAKSKVSGNSASAD